MNSINAIEQYLKIRHVLVDKDWIGACVQWVEEESEGRKINLEQLKTAVYDQWLFSDLREIGSISFPPDLVNLQKTLLNGNYAVQVMSIRDVSQPAYSQLMKLQGNDSENAKVSEATEQREWEPKSKRMLMMKITDGSQYLQAMEYKPIPSLNVNMAPGIKLLLRGSIECRLGVLMLTSEQVQVLGGDVEGLSAGNSYQNILANQLNRPDLVQNTRENLFTVIAQPDVVGVFDEPDHQNNDADARRQVIDRDSDFHNMDDDMYGDLSPDDFSDLQWCDSSDKNGMETEENGNDDQNVEDVVLLSDDDDFADAWEEMPERSVFLEPKNDLVRKPCPVFSEGPTVSHMISGADCSVPSHHLEERNLGQGNISNLSSGEHTITGNPKNASLCSKMEKVCAWESSPFTYLHYVLGQQTSMEPFVIKGYIRSVTAKLTAKPDTGWWVKAIVDDGSAFLEVVIANEVLTKFIGLTSQDVLKLKQDAKLNPSVMSKFREAVAKCQETLINLNCLMKIQLKPEPVLLKCGSVERYHIRQLLDRVLRTT